nr:MAG TPA: hypothetical protein [Caudoviricetes sp.]
MFRVTVARRYRPLSYSWFIPLAAFSVSELGP